MNILDDDVYQQFHEKNPPVYLYILLDVLKCVQHLFSQVLFSWIIIVIVQTILCPMKLCLLSVLANVVLFLAPHVLSLL